MYGKQAAEAGPLPRSCYHQASNAAHRERAQEIESAVRFRVVSISKPQHMQERYMYRVADDDAHAQDQGTKNPCCAVASER